MDAWSWLIFEIDKNTNNTTDTQITIEIWIEIRRNWIKEEKEDGLARTNYFLINYPYRPIK